MSRRAMVTVDFALMIGPAVRAPASGLMTLNAETVAMKIIETATANSTIFPCVLRLTLIKE